jgi:two-component system, NarL family, nitrate/nitrite response regulator NarL
MTPDLRVLVVADDPLARGGLAALLAGQLGLIVVGQTAAVPHDASGITDLAVALDAYQPDVLVWDLGWDAAPSLARLAELRDRAVPSAVLLAGVASAPAAHQAGAAALLPRDVSGPRLAAALAAIAQGLTVYDPAFLPPAAAIAPSAQPEWDETGPAPLVEELTPRELEVLRLLAEGLPNKTIAQSLRISEHTVKFHVNAILGKLGVQSRTEAVVRATRLGLILL